MSYIPLRASSARTVHACVCAQNSSPVPSRYSGYSLIELLVSLLIFSVAILGLASLQVTSLRMTQDAQLRYSASLLAGALASQLSTTKSLAYSDFWIRQVEETLPSGQALIESSASGYHVALSWKASEDQARQDGEGISELSLEVSL